MLLSVRKNSSLTEDSFWDYQQHYWSHQS